ncbi:MAG TPA: limonene-1,2-epoxide hydrolase family protein [Solirubrobacteraceae bacterium]|jgi:limonene-1,2-epoxide hydrolase|nr:limonene-1,2-epoxide hydrolase family protein [Solirubrobacteraceae bacterium]
MSSDPMSVVQSFFDQSAKGGELIEALDAHMAPNCVWENTGLPTAEGLDAMKGFMQSFIDGFSLHALVVEVRSMAASGGSVLTERIDHLDSGSGDRVASLPVSGTFEVSGGKIVAWRDYFDPRPFLPPA